MKKLVKVWIMMCAVISILSVVLINDVSIAVASKKITALNLYKNFLSSPHKLWGDVHDVYPYTTDDDVYFRVKDINADSVPELILYDARNCNATGQLAIYTVRNGKVKFVTSFTMYSVTFYGNKQGAMFHMDTRYSVRGVYYKYNGKQAKPYIGYTREWETKPDGSVGLGKKAYYTIQAADTDWKETSISKKKFTLLKNELLKGKKKFVISGEKDMYKNTSENRKKHIK